VFIVAEEMTLQLSSNNKQFKHCRTALPIMTNFLDDIATMNER